MPVTVRKRGEKYRIIEKETGRIAKNKNGKAMDGGGHDNKAKAGRQATAINSSKKRKS